MLFILLAMKVGASGIAHGECVLQIQAESSTMYSPLNPISCMQTSVCRQLSAPVAKPVSSSKYFRVKEFPDRGND